MQALSFGDWISVELFSGEGKDSLKTNEPSLEVDDSNLILKAVKLFKKETKRHDFHVHIDLDKRIPMMSGLGGGSSNAATTLWALNSLLDSPFDQKRLTELGAELGSDVPFFFSSGIAKCTGRGEVIKRASKTPFQEFWIARPKHINIPTPLVYKHCIPNVFSKESPQVFFKSFSSDSPSFINELEFPVFKLVPKLKSFKDKLFSYGFSSVMLTGSGSAFVALGKPTKMPPSIWLQKAYPLFRPEQEWYQP